jgi:translation initiation factor 1
MRDEKSRLVYSTDTAIPRKKNSAGKAPQVIIQPFLRASAPAVQQKVTVRLERKGRGGKTVTVIDGLQLKRIETEELLKELKAKLGTGGTIKYPSLEIQGDHRDMIMSELKGMGFAPKRSGG